MTEIGKINLSNNNPYTNMAKMMQSFAGANIQPKATPQYGQLRGIEPKKIAGAEGKQGIQAPQGNNINAFSAYAQQIAFQKNNPQYGVNIANGTPIYGQNQLGYDQGNCGSGSKFNCIS